MRAVIYARISSDDGRALGVKRQEADCRQHCEARDWVISDVLIDNDQSAYTGRRRPGYGTLLDGLRNGWWDVIVVWHPDRLHRRPAELEEFIDVVEASGVQVSTVTAGEFDLSTPEGRLVARITGSVARKESEDKSRRSRRKQLEKAQAGEVSGGGLRPFGYEPDKVTVRADEAAMIRDGATRILAGSSVRSVVLDWRDRIGPPRGGTWTNTGVKRVLTSPRIAGLRSHRGEIVGPAVWPAIIDPDDLYRIRTLLSDTRAPAARAHLLTGFLRCGICGTPLVSFPAHAKGKVYPSYRCSRDRGGCGSVKISAGPTEDLIAEDVVEYLTRDDVPEQAPALPDTDDVDARLVELAEMWADGMIGRAEWTSARDLLERRREKILAEGADAARRAAQTAWVSPDAAERWEAAGFDDRRAIIASAIVKVEIGPATHRGGQFDPERVRRGIEWRDPH